MAIVESLSAATASVRAALALAKKITNLEVQGQLIAAREKIVTAQVQMIELQQRNRPLRDEVARLRAMGAVRTRIVYGGNAYYLGDGCDADGPYCARCLDDDDRLVRLRDRGEGAFYCQQCWILGASLDS
jgi:hypothetical protein